MSDFVLAESFGRKNFQDRLYYVMDEEDLETLLTEKNVVMGDKVYIIREQRMVIRGNDSEWYDIGNGGGGGGGGDSDEGMVVDFEFHNDGGYDVYYVSTVPASEVITAYKQGKNIVFHIPEGEGFGVEEFYISGCFFTEHYKQWQGDVEVEVSCFDVPYFNEFGNFQAPGIINDSGLIQFNVYVD